MRELKREFKIELKRAHKKELKRALKRELKRGLKQAQLNSQRVIVRPIH